VGGLARACCESHPVEYKRDPLAVSFTIRRLLGVLRDNRDFRTLYAANAVSQIGGFMLTLSASTLSTGLLLDRGVPPRALMAACGLVALVPLLYWTFAQRAFEMTGQGGGE